MGCIGSVLVFISRHLDGAKIDDFLSGRVGDALVSERRDAQSDQYDRNYDLWSHRTSRFLKFQQDRTALLPSSPLNKADYHNDNGNHQHDVDEPSHRVTGQQPERPQNYQYYSNGP